MEGRRAGKPLCGAGRDNFFAFPFVIRGELDWKRKTLGLAKYNTSDAPCIFCPCNDSAIPWRDVRSNAIWTERIFTDALWRARNPNPKCCLFSLQFVSILALNPDWMHDMHLGIMLYAYGSVLWLLVYQLLVEGSPAKNMSKVMVELRKYWRAHATPGHFQGFSLSMFGADGGDDGAYPRLKGTVGEVKLSDQGASSCFQHLQISLSSRQPC